MICRLISVWDDLMHVFFLWFLWQIGLVRAENETWQNKIRQSVEYELYQALQQGIGANWSVLEISLSHVPFQVPSYCSIDQNVRIQFSNTEDYRGGITIFLEIYNEASICTRGRVVVYPEIYTELFVTEQSVTANQDIFYRKERSRYDKIDGHPVGEGDWIAIKTIGAGVPITTTNVREKPLAKDGTSVKVILVSGNIKIHSTGKLLEDGYQNRSVRVLLQTGKRVDGTMIDSNTVMILMK